MTTIPRHVELPEAFLSVTGLGAPVDYFPQSKSSRLTAPILAGLLIVGSIVSCGWSLDTGYGAYLHYGPAVVYDLATPPLFIAMGLFVFGIFLIGFSIANRGKSAVVYEKGLACQGRTGLESMRWEEIGEFYLSVTQHMSYGIPTGTTYQYTVKQLNGGRFVFDNRYQNVQHLGGFIGRHILPIQYQLAADIYNSGQTASFGPVAISRAGLVVAKKTYPWNEIEQVSIQKGIFKVSKKGGGWFSGASTPVASIPNLEAMLSIIDQVVGVKVG
jgi:Family of unknown function (DUF6585)